MVKSSVICFEFICDQLIYNSVINHVIAKEKHFIYDMHYTKIKYLRAAVIYWVLLICAILPPFASEPGISIILSLHHGVVPAYC
jgi:hypothetical protein